MREHDLPVLLPLAFGTAVLVGSDTKIEQHLPSGTATINRSKTFSDIGVAAFAGAGAGAYLLGRVRTNDRMRTTGVLSAEAAADSLLATEVIKATTGRERPFEGNGRGQWFQGGASFPSEHAAAAWSIATVVAGQYPGWMTKFLAYGGASAVSAARVIGQQHFTSDAVIGSALGWYIGRHALTHAKEMDNRKAYGTFESLPERPKEETKGPRSAKHMGSPYVPLESWIYPAFERLIALGYIRSGFIGIRPWTRLECARLLAEASDAMASASMFVDAGPLTSREQARQKRGNEVRRLYDALNREFAQERALLENGGNNRSAQVESVYTRVTGISGQPLTDGFHFGQTFFNDYGRPYQEGVNNVTGASSYGTLGPMVLYLRGEYQHAASAPALSSSTVATMARMDSFTDAQGNPLPGFENGGPFRAVNRFRLLDSYGGLNVSNWQLTFGKQSLWFGPNQGSSLILSNNAEPMYMLRLSRVSPFKLPSFLGVLGQIRTEIFVGQVQGHDLLRLGQTNQLFGTPGVPVDPQPFTWGQKTDFHPTANFEFGVSTLAIFAGHGRPMTLSTFIHTFSTQGGQQTLDPGKRVNGFDFSYRVPHLRNWLTLYAQGMTYDEDSPLAYPRRASFNNGIYVPQFPILRKADLHVEGSYTNIPNLRGTGVIYTNSHYAQGYTNYGQIMGSWLGRDSRGLQAWSTYWVSPRSKLRLGYRNQQVNEAFFQGGMIQDFNGGYDFTVKKNLDVGSSVQYEHWKYPAISNQPQSNVAVSVQLTYKPSWRKQF